ncbi:hypothetical protein HanIR_Chr01g0018701 [Helianthus annuus]|nr:hypothetical protein HanIR_Chr01g0018701 [Helianthus annuus]
MYVVYASLVFTSLNLDVIMLISVIWSKVSYQDISLTCYVLGSSSGSWGRSIAFSCYRSNCKVEQSNVAVKEHFGKLTWWQIPTGTLSQGIWYCLDWIWYCLDWAS